MFSNRWVRIGLMVIGAVVAVGIIGGIVMRNRIANDPELAAQFAERREGRHHFDEDCLQMKDAEDGAEASDSDEKADCMHAGRHGKGHGGHHGGHRRGGRGFGLFGLIGGLIRLAVVAALAAAMLNWWNKRQGNNAAAAPVSTPVPDTEPEPEPETPSDLTDTDES